MEAPADDPAKQRHDVKAEITDQITRDYGQKYACTRSWRGA
jgi:hypothetical protein